MRLQIELDEDAIDLLALLLLRQRKQAVRDGLRFPPTLEVLQRQLLDGSREVTGGQEGSSFDLAAEGGFSLQGNEDLTITEAARLLRWSTSTLKRRLRQGEMPVVRSGRMVRIRRVDLSNFQDLLMERSTPKC
jgi:excisionase family DNA binding protein